MGRTHVTARAAQAASGQGQVVDGFIFSGLRRAEHQMRQQIVGAYAGAGAATDATLPFLLVFCRRAGQLGEERREGIPLF